MTLQETLQAAKDAEMVAAVAHQQAAAALAVAQAAVDAAAPHMVWIQRVEAEMGNVSADVAARLQSAVTDMKAMLNY
jgi:hypothetical protein